jgi:threonine/homoserine/homoserine lactone efflux protein
LWLSATFTLLAALPGVLLLGFTVAFFLAFIDAMTTNPQAQGQFLVAGLMLALVWYLYIHLPQAIKRSITKLFRRSGGNHGGGHGH